ncbi:hypothetical protein COK46_26300, partial [Bacillus thuringiensis]
AMTGLSVEPALDHLALHHAAGIEHRLTRRLPRVEQRGVEQQPGQHLLVLHALRDMVDAGQPGLGVAFLRRLEIDLGPAAERRGAIEEIDEAA